MILRYDASHVEDIIILMRECVAGLFLLHRFGIMQCQWNGWSHQPSNCPWTPSTSNRDHTNRRSPQKETMTWHSQHEKAKKYPYQVVPGNAPPTEGTEDGSSSTNTSQGSPSGGQSHLSGGAIAGIAIGVLVFVAILVVFFFALGRNRVYQQWMSSQDGRTERTESTARWALFNNNPSIGPSWSTRKSEIDPGIQPIADHPATHISSPDPTHCAVSPPMGMHNSYMSMSGSPPPQQGQGIVGLWNWDMFGPQQQQQQSQLLPRPMPIELESNGRK